MTLPPTEKGLTRRDMKRFILSFMLVITISTGFNTFLSTLAFKTVYINSIISQYNVIGSVLKKKIELSLSFGKKIDHFYGMAVLLDNNLKYLTHLNPSLERSGVQLFISNTQGQILYTTQKTAPPKKFSPDTIESLTRVSGDWLGSKNFFIKDDYFFIAFPIKNGDTSLAAIQVISFPEKWIQKHLMTTIKQSLTTWAWVLSASLVILLLTCYYHLGHHQNHWESMASTLKSKKMSHGLFGIIVLCQLVFSAAQIHRFGKYYLAINQDKAATLNFFLKDQLEHLIKKGIDLKNLKQAEQFLGNMIEDTPEFSSIIISDPNGSLLYYADRNSRLSYQSKASQKPDLSSVQHKYIRTIALMDQDQKLGTISIILSKNVLNTFFKKIFLDTGTIIVVSIFFCVEIMILFFMGLGKNMSKKNQPSIRIIRPVAFVYFFAMDIVVSFVPLYMKNLYINTPNFFFSQDMVLGLPITVQMIFTAISILIVGGWCDKKGWLQPFLFGVFFSALGFLSAAISKSPILFIIALATAGFGYGLSYIAAQNFVTANSSPETKAQGLSEYYAGCIAGSLCGIVTGGMLAEQIGFANVFFVGFAILICLFVWVFFSMGSYLQKPIEPSHHKREGNPIPLLAFFKNKQIFYIIFLNIVPASIIIVGFLNYFVPVYLQANNISQSDIGRAFMLYGICLIYIAPFIIQKINVLKHSIAYITIGGILGSMTLLTFFFTSGYIAVVISILFLGLGASFNSLRNAYALNLDISKKFGEGRATSLIFFLARIGQALGPVIFAWFAISGDSPAGIVKVGLFFVALNIMFFILNHFDTRKSISK